MRIYPVEEATDRLEASTQMAVLTSSEVGFARMRLVVAADLLHLEAMVLQYCIRMLGRDLGRLIYPSLFIYILSLISVERHKGARR